MRFPRIFQNARLNFIKTPKKSLTFSRPHSSVSLASSILLHSSSTLTNPITLTHHSSTSTLATILEALSDSEVERILNDTRNRTIFIQFHATWCRPCKLLRPILLAAAAKHENIILLSVDVDECQEVSAKFKVASLPTVVVMKEGKVVDSFVGLLNQTAVNEFFSKNLKD